MNLLKLPKWLPKITTERKILYPLVLVLIVLLFFKNCDNKEVKSLKAELENCEADLLACDTAKITIEMIEPEPTAPKAVPIPEPLVIENGATIQALKSQVRRNKLKQVQLIGDCDADAIENARAIKERDKEIETLTGLLNEQGADLVGLQGELQTRLYRDSIRAEKYNADYEISTKGTLTDFQLSVDPKQTVINRTIKQRPTEAEIKAKADELKKNNFIGLMVGSEFIDELDNTFWTPSVIYGHKGFVIEAGVNLDKNFTKGNILRGVEAKAGFNVKF